MVKLKEQNRYLRGARTIERAFKLIVFIYLAVLGLRYGMQDL